MASIKVKFRPSSGSYYRGTIYYQISHNRVVRNIMTEYLIFPHEWDCRRARIKLAKGNDRSSDLISIHAAVRLDMERLNRILGNLELRGYYYTADDVVDDYMAYMDRYTLFHIMEINIELFKEKGHFRTSETYRAALNSFRKFRNGNDIMVDSLNSEIMQAYEAWLKSHGNCMNTVSFYMRILRAAYNRALEEGSFTDRKPFRRVYTGVDKTIKRALPLSIIKRLKSLDLTHSPALDYARDMFMMSFMLRGMSFVDMSFLKKSDLTNGHIIYVRRKTGQRLTIKWTPEMQRLLDKYPENRSRYLLPIIRGTGVNERCVYRNVGYNINHNLKRIARSIGIPGSLTMYVARHSWASVAKAKGIPLSIISEGMGHESESTTLIYLASLDTAAVDKANSLILGSL